MYAGLLSSLGLGFLLDTAYLLPFTAAFLLLALGALAYRAKTRRGYGPFVLGIFAVSIALIGKFAFLSDPLSYVGLAVLVGASLWNAWPRKVATVLSCPRCAQQETTAQRSSAQQGGTCHEYEAES